MTNEQFDSMTLGRWYLRFFGFCKALGISRVNVEYSGGGDSGGTDHIEFVPKDPDSKISSKITSFIREELEEQLSNPIYDRHGSFADGGGYNVSGRVVYDAEGNRAWIEGTDHYYEYNETEDGEEEEAEETNEDFDEMLYEFEEGEGFPEDREFDLLVAYAKLNNENLPVFIQNYITAAAIAGDENAKEYMEWLGNS